jgi:hypothetical protein
MPSAVWKNGYDATTTDDLRNAMNSVRRSLNDSSGELRLRNFRQETAHVYHAGRRVNTPQEEEREIIFVVEAENLPSEITQTKVHTLSIEAFEPAPSSQVLFGV